MNPLSKSLHRRELERHIKKILPTLLGEILDIGSKNRRYDYLLPSRPTAVDLISNKEKDVLQGDIQKLSFGDSSFDSVLCLEVIEYVEFPEKAMEEIFRVLKENGKIVASIPFMMRVHEDRGRYTEMRLHELFRIFKNVKIIEIGNFYTIALDIFRGKIMEQIFPVRIILSLLWLPLLVFLPLSKISKDGRYVSGYIVVAEK